jgi:hypothetical protein
MEKIPEWSIEARGVRAGTWYRHYKGNRYRVVGVARHSETLEEMVVYQGEGGEVWVRPLTLFVESVEVGGVTLKRFAPL